MSNVKYNAAKYYENYKKHYCETMSYGYNITVPIFITPNEREDYNKIKNKKSEIVAVIKKNVTEMPENDLASAFQKDYAKEKWLKHHKLVSLCYEVNKNKFDIKKYINFGRT